MRILNEPEIRRFMREHPDSRDWLENWLEAARVANWRTIQDVRKTYSTADGGVRVASDARVMVFDVGGNKYRMVADVNYAIRTVAVLELMTHAEYSKDRWKQRY